MCGNVELSAWEPVEFRIEHGIHGDLGGLHAANVLLHGFPIGQPRKEEQPNHRNNDNGCSESEHLLFCQLEGG
jgi:hypothetical protein